jgi:hypothetical protein
LIRAAEFIDIMVNARSGKKLKILGRSIEKTHEIAPAPDQKCAKSSLEHVYIKTMNVAFPTR